MIFGLNMRSIYAQLFGDAHGAMRSLVWHNNQPVSVFAMILAIVNEAET